MAIVEADLGTVSANRRRLLRGGLALAGMGLLAGCGIVPATGVRTARPTRVGWLVVGLSGPPGPLMRAFSEGLRDLGYSEGRDVVIEYRFAEGKEERLSSLAVDLVTLPVDVIVAGSPQAAAAAKSATATTPIVAVVPDPVQSGLAASLNRPGGNVTGLSSLSGVIMAKRLELLKGTVPGLTRVALLADPGQGRSATDAIAGSLREPAAALGLEILPVPVPDGGNLEPAVAAAKREQAQAVLALGGEIFITERVQLAEITNRAGLASMYSRQENVEAGGLMSYAPSAPAQWRRAAHYVDKILRGTKPADLPIEQPTTFDFVINLRAAEALGLSIPPSVLQQATEVIQ
jgi:putative ABC transport system substrate-binding protein